MGQTITLGGDRLGSGKKLKQELHNYFRSTHNLGCDWASSMAAGVLYPFMVIPAMRGDSFTIDLEAASRTIPTHGPLFGSFKMQLDVFQCPFRLYQAILHNNPTAIGLKMSQVKLPKIQVQTAAKKGKRGGFSTSCLQKYLGMSGIGRGTGTMETINRQYLAIPTLAYYDIFKNYYANKQEDNAYVITPNFEDQGITEVFESNDTTNKKSTMPFRLQIPIASQSEYTKPSFTIIAKNRDLNIGKFQINCSVILTLKNGAQISTDLSEANGISVNSTSEEPNKVFVIVNQQKLMTDYGQTAEQIEFKYIDQDKLYNIHLEPFPLKNIDDMRMDILSMHDLGRSFVIDKNTPLPYGANTKVNANGQTYNEYPLNGLLVKTYQSDIFNNWINTEWISGENGIAEITKIAVNDGAFTIDALNLAEKLYNMLNRVAISGGTYEEWQDAVYTQSPRRHIESPVYLGGMSNEVVFEEIVQTASTDTENGELGTLGGRGILVKRKGGNVDVKVDEASFIIGIVSLTPRIYQTQSNKWYNTELDSMDDLHKPSLDGIGFQNLIGEQMAWFDTQLHSNAQHPITRHTIGKVPAWINYMTDYDEAYGDFAEPEGKGFMVLARNYEEDETNGGIADATTYIDPSKYNYAFAYTELQAQNFWVQIRKKIKARRLMSAKQIPNI